jgi:hypothetical protein
MHLDVSIGKSAADDAVEILGETLRRHRRLPATGRTTLEVGESGRAIVELVDDLFRLHRHLVDGAIGEVHDLFGMAETEHPARAVSLRVTGIRRRRRVAASQRDLHVGITLDRTCKPPIADGEESSIPIRHRHPELDVDVGVRCWFEHHLHAAVLGDRFAGFRCSALSTAASTRLHEWASRYHRGAGDRGLREPKSHQAVTRMRWRRGSEKREAEDSEHR